ncbi:MAG TPA: site-specific integrase [Sedimentisphaerales bacterium]|nr:site-specific integrase [Sedimentisphaerales bacterium]HRV48156.1 site-specific integrase [Sedimentisphaerales bacterium]
MRVFKPSYTVPLPEGAKILRRKNGNVAKFTNARGQEIIAPVSKSGKRVALETNSYHLEFRDHNNFARRLKAFTDEGASQRVAATIEDLLAAKGSSQGINTDLRRRIEALPKTMRMELAKWGLLDQKANTATKPLRELIAAFEAHLKAKERTKSHISKTIYDLRAICEACQFVFFSDIDCGRLESYLRQRREAGNSFRRSNLFLSAMKAFCNWLLRERIVTENPVFHIRPLNVKQDRRRIRRALEVEEVRRLLSTTAKAKTRHNLTGPERALIYKLAIETGLRRGELAKLTIGAFHFDTLTIEIDATISKNKRSATLPIRPDTAHELKAYFQGKLPTARAFKGIPWDTAAMLRDDLEEAGIPYRDEQGRVFDFHALRGQCGTLLARAGVHPKTAQTILRHSDVNLTMNIYSHVLRGAESQAVSALPDLSIGGDKEAARTGTDGQ